MNTHDDTESTLNWAHAKVSPFSYLKYESSFNSSLLDKLWPVTETRWLRGPTREEVQIILASFSRRAYELCNKTGLIPELAVTRPRTGLQFTYLEDGVRYYHAVESMREAHRTRLSLGDKSFLELITVSTTPLSQIDEMANEEYKQSHEYKQDIAELERLKLKVG
jgi:hypothetical protein